jgi:cell division protease FtsH
MPVDSWLPVGTKLPDGSVCRAARLEGIQWQIYDLAEGGRALVVADALASRWVSAGLLTEELLLRFDFGSSRLRAFVSGPHHALTALEGARSPATKAEALAFALALRHTRAHEKDASLHDALYAERISRLLPVWSLSTTVSDDVVFGTWLTGGVQVSVMSFRRLMSLMTWLGRAQLQEVVEAAGFRVAGGVETGDDGAAQSGQAGPVAVGDASAGPENARRPFGLAGRPQLEQFLREHVIDIVENADRYRALGIEFPSAIVLHGPPGCGKTYAVDRLVDYLGWPSFAIDSGSIGSPYIHETGRKIAEIFDRAIKAAPAVMVIDEMESFLSDRQTGQGWGVHHVEEVAEFLRRIPEAAKHQVLIVAMTNRLDLIDPAILRRGRFDHVIEVGMPSSEEVGALLSALLAELPSESGITLQPVIDRLTGRPLSDVAFVLREAARLAARAGRMTLDQDSLLTALESVLPRDANAASRPIGFSG